MVKKIYHLAKTAISHYRLIHYFKTLREFIKNLLQSIYWEFYKRNLMRHLRESLSALTHESIYSHKDLSRGSHKNLLIFKVAASLLSNKYQKNVWKMVKLSYFVSWTFFWHGKYCQWDSHQKKQKIKSFKYLNTSW